MPDVPASSPAPREHHVLSSTSRAEDMGFLAVRDVAAVTNEIGADYRLVGGQMVSHLVHAYAVENVPARETADADLGATGEVVSRPDLVEALRARGYRQVSGNRFVRDLSHGERPSSDEDGGLRPVIDVLVPSGTSRHQPNQPVGDLVVDAIPGLLLALNAPPVLVSVTTTLTTGTDVAVELRLPSPKAALCLKISSFGSRFAAKDAVDVWRLLAVCDAAGLRPDDWRHSGFQGDALGELDTLVSMGSKVLAACIPDQRTRATMVALRHRIAPRPR